MAAALGGTGTARTLRVPLSPTSTAQFPFAPNGNWAVLLCCVKSGLGLSACLVIAVVLYHCRPAHLNVKLRGR